MGAVRKAGATRVRDGRRKDAGHVALYAVGDTGPQHPHPRGAFAKVQETLSEADILFGNLEAPISDKGSPGMTRGAAPSTAPRFFPLRADPSTMGDVKSAEFDILSLANNHAMDFGSEALLDCLERLAHEGIAHIGAGRNLQEATSPVVLERNGVRIAFLAYNAFFKGLGRIDSSTIAGPDNPGIAPIRISPLYASPHVYMRDLKAMEQAIKEALGIADQVVVSCHWGVGYCYGLGVHQEAIGHAAIDAGASVVLGHHPHILQGMEAYNGGLICYSLGEFAFELPYNVPGSLDTILLKCTLSKTALEGAAFLPVVMDQSRTPEVASVRSEDGRRIVDLMEELSGELNTELVVDQNEVLVRLRL